ncbi:hypothetical protein HG537_0A07100 [Torulaspora globosa]|uniref:C2H2-type domain-containing protein n=1 Tax=Torulaspora globosa TaxID=48254 RepID=A0A7H9HME6_9SACH|nr:hypothetical protein HG537_0A07100 [Torulaspora sp. CBS 2947]
MAPSCIMDGANAVNGKKDGLSDEGVVHGHIHNYDNMTLIHGHVHRTPLPAGETPADRSLLQKEIMKSGVMPLGDNQLNEKCLSDDNENLDCQFFQFVNYHQGGKPAGWTANDTSGAELLQPKPSLGNLYNDQALLLPSSKRKFSHGAGEENCHCPPKILEICCNATHDATTESNSAAVDVIPRAINRDELRRYKKNRRPASKNSIDSFATPNLDHLVIDSGKISSDKILNPRDLDFEDDENDDENIFEKFCEECLNLGYEHKHGVSSSPENLDPDFKDKHCQCCHTRHPHDHSSRARAPLPRENSATTLSSTQSANSELELINNGETYQCASECAANAPSLAAKKYPSHFMNSQLDLQILDDLCNISSLYEVPFANHMNHHNHHHHNISEHDGNQGINLLESTIKCEPSFVSNSKSHNHHHHRVQLQNCTANCQPRDMNQGSHSNSLNGHDITSVLDNKNYSFERSTIPKTESPVSDDVPYQTSMPKTEGCEITPQESTIAFNWLFKKDENAIHCKWDQCPESFSSLIDLQRHMLKDHVADEDPSCYWIPCTFKGEDTCSLINHINSDHGINFGLNITTSDSCIKPMTIEQDCQPPILQAHSVKPEETSLVPKFHCKWGDCTAELDSAASLTKHLEEEHLDRGKSEYQCLWRGCNRKFAQRQKLVRHLKVHSGYKPHKCQVCGKCFSNEDTLTQHMRIHSGEKPFECHICGKRFAVSSSLKIHIRTHTGEKPLECKICGKRFSESSNLSKHMKCHKKKYSCSHCKRGFDTIEKFQAHEARCFKKSK